MAETRQTSLPCIEDSKQKKQALPSQLFYNLPGSAKVVVEFGNNSHTSAILPIAQFGVAVPLAQTLLLQKNTPQIYFNTQTGNILTIQK